MSGSTRLRNALVLLSGACVHALHGWEKMDSLCDSFPNRTLRIGVLSKGNPELTVARWGATFETYLAHESDLPGIGCSTQLIPVGFDQYLPWSRAGRLDFFFGNPVAIQELLFLVGARASASVQRRFGTTGVLDQFGGVLVRSASRLTDIHSIADIGRYKGLTICAVDSAAFGGWRMQWYEMLLAGVVVDSHTVTFLGNHEDCILGVVSGEVCDIGIARTETMERLISTDLLSVSDVSIIGERKDEVHFPLHLSTALYPEWALATLPHVSPMLEYFVSVPLMRINESSQTAIIGQHAGFSFPYSYEQVERLLLALDHFGTGQCAPGHERTESSGQWSPGQCEPCPEQSFSSSGAGECQLCPAGSGNIGIGNSECTVGVNVPEVDVEDELLPLGLVYTCWAVTIVLYVCAAILALWTVRYRRSAVMVASQFEFLLMIVFGVVVSLAATFPMSLDHRWFDPVEGVEIGSEGLYPGLDKACRAQVWLYVIGFTLTFGPLLGKLWRVKKIMINPGLRNVKITTKDMLLRIATLLVFEVVVVLVWMLVDPMFYKMVEVSDARGYTTSTYGYCSPGDSVGTFFLVLVAAFSLLLLLGGLVLVLQARHVPTEYNEGKYIAISVANTLQATLLVGLLAPLIYSAVVASFVVLYIAFVVSNAGTLGLIFLPKIIQWYIQTKMSPVALGAGYHSSGQKSSGLKGSGRFSAFAGAGQRRGSQSGGKRSTSNKTEVVLQGLTPSGASGSRKDSVQINEVEELRAEVEDLRAQLQRLKYPSEIDVCVRSKAASHRSLGAGSQRAGSQRSIEPSPHPSRSGKASKCSSTREEAAAPPGSSHFATVEQPASCSECSGGICDGGGSTPDAEDRIEHVA